MERRSIKKVKLKHYKSEEEEGFAGNAPNSMSTNLHFPRLDEAKLAPPLESTSGLMPYLTSPHSPVYKMYQVLASPARYLDKKIRPGGIKGSMFNLICGVLGTGMLTLPVI